MQCKSMKILQTALKGTRVVIRNYDKLLTSSEENQLKPSWNANYMIVMRNY